MDDILILPKKKIVTSFFTYEREIRLAKMGGYIQVQVLCITSESVASKK